ncbi:S-adenosyl-L-methionine-dependent methyltransferase [Phialemonium atrogriseum]|uniref:S-adenosyl-L-methionine-dependent methyltransferase n=1 Tax=Phialemonium atrogriseum TaxID=1093897 RepID=A0AAJ0BZ19_9PEZI|nr:S-adenosyl-L-methionine-dependent methyltransferase [Phialemonium atrogriseum]KAK1767094.1 S-adenosyl-L-methionine-dependent methyltransferase [Phialemonium atrogriseum]
MYDQGRPSPFGQAQRKEYEENGRFYHSWRKGKYMFPCDEEEKDRLDIFHKFFCVARRGELHTAPLLPDQAPHRILDLGCGTGIWAIDMAEKYYDNAAHVKGLDLTLMQPAEIPRNIEFAQMDVETPWQGMDLDSLDLIHMRTLKGSIQSWPQLYAQIFRHLKPYYGHIEQVEIDWTPRCEDGTLPERSITRLWVDELLGAMDDHGRSMRVDSQETINQLLSAGFVDVKEEVIKVPFSGWPTEKTVRDIGRWFNLGFTNGLMGLTLAPLTRMKDRTKAEVAELVNKVKMEACSRNVHAFCLLYVWTARRPQ